VVSTCMLAHCGLPRSVSAHPRRLRPVAEAVGVLALTIEQVERHARAFVGNAERREGASPLFDGLLEGEVRIELLGDVTCGDREGAPW